MVQSIITRRRRNVRLPTVRSELYTLASACATDIQNAEHYKKMKLTMLNPVEAMFECMDPSRYVQSEGDRRMDKIKFYLTHMHKDFEEFQKTTIWEYTKALIPHIYGEEWDRDPIRIMKKYGITALPRGVLVVAPRRFGKTVCTSAFILAMALAVPGMSIAIFSTGERASQALKKEVMQFVRGLKGIEKRIVKRSGEDLVFSQDELPDGATLHSEIARVMAEAEDASRLMFFPDSETGLRGFTAKCAVLEEAAYMSQGTFTNVVAPCFGVKNFTVLALSTPDDEMNWYSVLLENGYFRTVNFGMACEVCTRQGEAAKCTHTNVTLPKWKTKEGQRMLKLLLANDQGAFEREVLGLVVGRAQLLFDKSWLYKFEQRPRYTFKRPGSYDFLFMAVDPSGGGSKSDFAIVTTAREGKHYVVCENDAIVSITNDSIVTPMGNCSRLAVPVILFVKSVLMSWMR